MLKYSSRLATTFGATKPKVTDLELRVDQLEKSLMKLQQAHKTQAMRAGVQATPVKLQDSPMMDALEAKQFTELYEFSSRQPAKLQTLHRLSVIDNPTDLRLQAIFIAREIKVRLAHGAAELAHSPFGFAQMESVKKLRRFHELSYIDMTKVSALNFAETQNIVSLCEVLQRIYQRHHVTCDLIASGIREFVQRNQLDEHLTDLHSSLNDYGEFQAYLEGVLANRVKIRYQIGHFIECARLLLPEADKALSVLDGSKSDWSDVHVAPRFVGHDPSTFVGSFCRAMNMSIVTKLAIENARQVMSDGGAVRCPPVDLQIQGDPEHTFPFPPRQAFNVITSLVAHSMKQEMRRAAHEMRVHNGQMNPVEVLVVQKPSNRDAVVRIRDRGGGIPLNELESVQTCLYSVRKNESLALGGTEVELKGWMKSAIRVPYASVLARVFGGDLSVISADGESTTKCFWAPTSDIGKILV